MPARSGPTDSVPATDRRTRLRTWLTSITRRARSPLVLLGVVAVAHGLSPILLLGVHWGLGTDESIYLSQLNAHVPVLIFSAPRARGMTYLVAPVTLLTAKVGSVRLWLALLSAVALFLAYRPWLRLRPGYTVPVAALVFSSIWSVAFYGFEAMPNEWVAFAVLAATGYTIQFLRDGRYGHLVWVVLGLAVAGLFRPSDAGFAAVGLIAACAVFHGPPRLRVRVSLAVILGTGLGCAQWVVEAYTSFGGVGHRIALARAEQGSSGLGFSGRAQAHALDGPLLCRWNCHADAAPIYWAWWVVGALLVAAAMVLGRRQFRRSPEMVAIVVAVASAAQYLLTVSYSAPRFLIPAYALLALPCAAAAVRLRSAARWPRVRLAVTAAFVTVFLANAAIQGTVIVRSVIPHNGAFAAQIRGDAYRLRAAGLSTNCAVVGQPQWNAALAYAVRCTNIRPTVAQAHARGIQVVWIGAGAPPARYGLTWARVRLPSEHGPRQFAYISAQQGSST